MPYPPSLHRRLLVLSLGLSALPTWADDDCDAPLDRWQTREAVRQMGTAQGWQIQRLKIDDGCYEVRGIDAQGRGFKAQIDPETLKVLKFKPDRHLRTREHECDRTQDGAARSTPVPASASGAVPRGQVQ